MMPDQNLLKKKNTVRKYFSDGGGIFVCSEDAGFITFVRRTLKDIVGEVDVATCPKPGMCVSEAKKRLSCHENLVMLVEKNVAGNDSLDEIGKIKAACGENVRIVIICREPTRPQVVYSFEKGADNVIGLPISPNAFVEKLSNTIVPVTAFTRKVHECKGLIAEKRIKEAKRLILELNKEKDDSCICRIMMGEIEELEGNMASAEKSYVAACSLAPQFLDPLQKLVSLYVKTGQTENKLEILSKLDSMSPLNYERKIQIGATHLEMGDETSASTYFEKAISLVRREAENKIAAILMEVAQAMKSTNPEKSIEYMEKAISSKPKLSEEDMWMFNNMGILLRREGRIEDARKCYQRALGVSPQAEIHYNIGRTYMDEDNPQAAAKSFDMARRIKPAIVDATPRVPFEMGQALFKIGKTAEAGGLLEKALKAGLSGHQRNEAANLAQTCRDRQARA